MDYLKIFTEISRYPSVSGHEKEAASLISKIFSQHCESVSIDHFYNVVGIKRGTGDKRNRILVTAHIDEIGLMVTSIDDNGFIRVTNVGGIDARILLAQQVIIHGKKDVEGVVGAKPPHLLKDDERIKAVKISDLCIDTGMSVDKVKEIITIGNLVTIKADPHALQNKKIFGRALDNRCGVVVLIETMKKLGKVIHSSDVYFAATTQEEFRLAGVSAVSYDLQPDMAVVVDVCHGDMPGAPRDETYKLGKGPAVAVGPVLNRYLSRRLIDTAKENGIPYQIDVEPDDTGTEAWATQVSRSGIPTALVSIPLRYMHTPVETVNTEDIKNSARLIAELIAGIEENIFININNKKDYTTK